MTCGNKQIRERLCDTTDRITTSRWVIVRLAGPLLCTASDFTDSIQGIRNFIHACTRFAHTSSISCVKEILYHRHCSQTKHAMLYQGLTSIVFFQELYGVLFSARTLNSADDRPRQNTVVHILVPDHDERPRDTRVQRRMIHAFTGTCLTSSAAAISWNRA